MNETCSHCGARLDPTFFAAQTTSGWVCWNCREKYYGRCRGCRKTLLVSQMYDGGLCPECFTPPTTDTYGSAHPGEPLRLWDLQQRRVWP